MFFRKKGWLRKEFDDKLLSQIEEIKQNWRQQKLLLDKCVDPSNEVISQAKLAEAKYFFLFKEAKARRISLNR